MTGPYEPQYIVAGSQDFVLLNALGPFGYEDRLDWISPAAPLRDAEEDASEAVFGAIGMRARQTGIRSWVSLGELQRFDLDQAHVASGYVSEELARHFREPPAPFPSHAFSRGVASPRNEPKGTTNHGSFATPVRWLETAREWVGPFWEEAVPKLEGLGPPDRVRLFVYLS
ncbi:MAG: hypothetical protein QNK04_04925 [Myxococcota bacterium]|nr:hypothetical protein [Myxococcota bacterium]